jgi:hypothetical protein
MEKRPNTGNNRNGNFKDSQICSALVSCDCFLSLVYLVYIVEGNDSLTVEALE